MEKKLEIYTREELLSKTKEEIVDILFEVIIQQSEEIKILKSKLGISKKDSTNSSKPPSTDYKKNSDKAKNENKKSGPPKGHLSHHKKLSKEPDRIVEYNIKECPECGYVLDSKSKNFISRQYLELLEIRIEIIEEKRQFTTCSCCKKTVYASVPQEETIAPKQYVGPYLKTFISLLYYNFGVSRSKIREFINTYSDNKLSLGLIDKIMKELLRACKPLYNEIRDRVKCQSDIGVDETGWRVKGENNWAWVFQNKSLTFYVIKPSRASKVPIKILGNDFNGILISDFYSSYSPVKAGKKSKCNAHFIRDLKHGIELENNPNGFCNNTLNILLDALSIRKIMEIYSEFDKDKKFRNIIEQRIDSELIKTDLKNISKRLQKRLQKYREDIFLFLYDLQAPFTNNTSEQAERKIVMHRKRSNGSQSRCGADTIAVAMSVIETAKKQSWDIVNIIEKLFQNLHTKNFNLAKFYL